MADAGGGSTQIEIKPREAAPIEGSPEEVVAQQDLAKQATGTEVIRTDTLFKPAEAAPIEGTPEETQAGMDTLTGDIEKNQGTYRFPVDPDWMVQRSKDIARQIGIARAGLDEDSLAKLKTLNPTVPEDVIISRTEEQKRGHEEVMNGLVNGLDIFQRIIFDLPTGALGLLTENAAAPFAGKGKYQTTLEQSVKGNTTGFPIVDGIIELAAVSEIGRQALRHPGEVRGVSLNPEVGPLQATDWLQFFTPGTGFFGLGAMAKLEKGSKAAKVLQIFEGTAKKAGFADLEEYRMAYNLWLHLKLPPEQQAMLLSIPLQERNRMYAFAVGMKDAEKAALKSAAETEKAHAALEIKASGIDEWLAKNGEESKNIASKLEEHGYLPDEPMDIIKGLSPSVWIQKAITQGKNIDDAIKELDQRLEDTVQAEMHKDEAAPTHPESTGFAFGPSELSRGMEPADVLAHDIYGPEAMRAIREAMDINIGRQYGPVVLGQREAAKRLVEAQQKANALLNAGRRREAISILTEAKHDFDGVIGEGKITEQSIEYGEKAGDIPFGSAMIRESRTNILKNAEGQRFYFGPDKERVIVGEGRHLEGFNETNVIDNLQGPEKKLLNDVVVRNAGGGIFPEKLRPGKKFVILSDGQMAQGSDHESLLKPIADALNLHGAEMRYGHDFRSVDAASKIGAIRGYFSSAHNFGVEVFGRVTEAQRSVLNQIKEMHGAEFTWDVSDPMAGIAMQSGRGEASLMKNLASRGWMGVAPVAAVASTDEQGRVRPEFAALAGGALVASALSGKGGKKIIKDALLDVEKATLAAARGDAANVSRYLDRALKRYMDKGLTVDEAKALVKHHLDNPRSTEEKLKDRMGINEVGKKGVEVDPVKQVIDSFTEGKVPAKDYILNITHETGEFGQLPAFVGPDGSIYIADAGHEMALRNAGFADGLKNPVAKSFVRISGDQNSLSIQKLGQVTEAQRQAVEGLKARARKEGLQVVEDIDPAQQPLADLGTDLGPGASVNAQKMLDAAAARLEKTIEQFPRGKAYLAAREVAKSGLVDVNFLRRARPGNYTPGQIRTAKRVADESLALFKKTVDDSLKPGASSDPAKIAATFVEAIESARGRLIMEGGIIKPPKKYKIRGPKQAALAKRGLPIEAARQPRAEIVASLAPDQIDHTADIGEEIANAYGGLQAAGTDIANLISKFPAGDTARLKDFRDSVVAMFADKEAIKILRKQTAFERPEGGLKIGAAVFRDIMRNGLLSGYADIRNALNGVVQTASIPLDTLFTATVDVAKTAIVPGHTRQVFFGEIPIGFAAMRTGFLKGFKEDFLMILKEGPAADELAKLDLSPEVIKLMRQGEYGTKGRVVGEVANVLALGEIPQRIAIGTDAMFKRGFQDWHLQSRAYREAAKLARQAGLDASEQKALMVEFVAHPRGKWVLEARDFARYETFNADPGTYGRALIAGRNKLPVIGDILLPFITTRLNILKGGAARSPLAIIPQHKIKGSVFEKGISSEEHSRRLGKAIAGTVTMVAAGYEVTQGNLTGSGPDFDDPRYDQWNKTHQPYSVRIGGNWFDYSNVLGSWAIPIMWTADAIEAATFNKKKDPAAQFGSLVQGWIGSIFEQNDYYESTKELLDFVSAWRRGEDLGDKFADWAAKTAQQATPASAAMRAYENVTDDSRHVPSPSLHGLKRFEQKYRAPFPFNKDIRVSGKKPVSGGRALLPVKVKPTTPE